MSLNKKATKMTGILTHWLGSVPAIVGSILMVLIWALCGPIFNFSSGWQLTINTATTIITFNMVFIIQASQNRDGRAIQTKLDAIIEALEQADNKLVGLEEEPEIVIKKMQSDLRKFK